MGFVFLISPRNICCGYLLESPHRGDSNKYPQHMLLEILNATFLNISNNSSHLELRICSIQTVVITSFVVISNVGLEMVDCTRKITTELSLLPLVIYSSVKLKYPQYSCLNFFFSILISTHNFRSAQFEYIFPVSQDNFVSRSNISSWTFIWLICTWIKQK